MSDAPRIRMEGISKRYGAAFALQDVDVRGPAGRDPRARSARTVPASRRSCASCPGPCLPTPAPWRSTAVAYHPRSPHDARDQGIRAVHQEFSLVPQLSVAENLLLGELPTLAPGIVDWATAHREAGESLAALGFEGIDTHLRVDHLGVSQRQMVEIAKALRGTPRVVILDEPSAVLSNEELERLFAVLRAFREDGGTVDLRLPPPRRGPAHLRPHHGPQGRRAGGHRGDRRGRLSTSSSA